MNFINYNIFKKRTGFTLVETIVVVGIMSLVFTGIVQIFQYIGSSQSSKSSKDIIMIKNSRRLFLKVFTELQEGMEIIHPVPGVTLPYLVFVDRNNDITVYYLKKNLKAEKDCGEFMLCTKTREIGMAGYGTKCEERILMKNVDRMTFTAHGGGVVLVNARLKINKNEFNLLTMVNLKNFRSSI